MRAALQSCHHRKPPNAPPTPAIATRTSCPLRTFQSAQDAMVSSVWGALSIGRNDRPDLLQAHLVVAIPGGHIGHDNAIARRKAADDFRAALRHASELHVDAPRFCPVVGNLKDRHSRIWIGLQLLRQICGMRDALRFNRAVYRYAGMRASRLRAVGLDVHADRAVL